MRLRQRKGSTGMVRPGAMATYGVVARPWTKLDAMWLATADATRQVSAISGHVPETLTSVTLQHAVRRLRYSILIHFWDIASIVSQGVS